MLHIKAQQESSIPKGFMIPPDEHQEQYTAMKKKLTGKQTLLFCLVQQDHEVSHWVALQRI